MKVKPENPSKKKARPFLILPLLDNLSILTPSEELQKMPKNTGLKLFTKTWPPKREIKKINEEQTRPLTATLEKPTILDINLISKIDMSTIRKEFLNISNLCRMPLILKTRKSTISRPLSLPSNEKCKKNKRKENSEDSLEDDESTNIRSARKSKMPKPNNRLKNLEAMCKKNNIKLSISDSNNNKSITKNDKLIEKINEKNKDLSDKSESLSISSLKSNETKHLKTRKQVIGGKISNVNNKNEVIKSTKLLPEPCTTCGRADLPERFHSHPTTPALKPVKKMEEPPKIPVKNTVQKPVAIKYKSKQSASENRQPIVRKPSLPAQKLVHTPPVSAVKSPVKSPGFENAPGVKSPESAPPRVRSAKRLLTCYLCGREFGSASLPLHEPKCLEKWERENMKLPASLQRKPPVKPDQTLNQEDFNKLAWESAQAMLIPCLNCGRTFFPDRLEVHQRSCKTPQLNRKIIPEMQPITITATPVVHSTPTTPATPQGCQCYICGRLFGTSSIKLHEKNCLKKWNMENDSLPPDIRTNQPIKGDTKPTPSLPNCTLGPEKPEPRSVSGRRPPLFPCYLCGKLFTVNSIYIHEPQCLKMWKVENDKLPPTKRRPTPTKPDIKFTQDGKVNFEAMNDDNWQSHLSQLIPCRICNRTFNPDRVDVHEKSCKG